MDNLHDDETIRSIVSSRIKNSEIFEKLSRDKSNGISDPAIRQLRKKLKQNKK